MHPIQECKIFKKTMIPNHKCTNVYKKYATGKIKELFKLDKPRASG
jgi:hypothetical protein